MLTTASSWTSALQTWSVEFVKKLKFSVMAGLKGNGMLRHTIGRVGELFFAAFYCSCWVVGVCMLPVSSVFHTAVKVIGRPFLLHAVSRSEVIVISGWDEISQST